MEENTRQRVTGTSEINMDIDETTAVLATTEDLGHKSGNINTEITGTAISSLMADQNHHLTDSILHPEKAEFCQTSYDMLPVSMESDNLPSSLEEDTGNLISVANCAILVESKMEPSRFVPGTTTIGSGVDMILEQEMIDFVPTIMPVTGHSIVDSLATSRPKEDISLSVKDNLKETYVFEENLPANGEEGVIESKDICLDNEDDVDSAMHEYPSVSITDFNSPIRQVASAYSDFQNGDQEGFTKGCKWSPDGLCLLTNSEDNALRVFELPRELQRWRLPSRTEELPEMRAVLRMPEGGLIYDYCWYPLMTSFDPSTCCLISSAQDNPVHLWDAYDGALRATYRPYNLVDEIEAATSLAFSPSGDKIYCGFKNRVRIFDTAVPGRDCDTRELRDKKVRDSQKGIVSCISVNPADPKIFSVGTYLKSIGIYSAGQRQAVAYLLGHAGGLTQLTFSADGARLYSGGRRDSEILCWDLRNSAQVLYTMQREVLTNQRIQFDVTSDGSYLVSGGTDGTVTVWDLAATPHDDGSGGDPVLPTMKQFRAHADCVNGVSVHDKFPVLATSSGQRHFPASDFSSTESLNSDPCDATRKIAAPKREDCVKLWWTGAYE